MAKTTSLWHPCDPDHALILRELSKNVNLPCLICELHFNGPTYCCWDCNVFLHKSCAELPLKTQHPAHPQHPALSITITTINICDKEGCHDEFCRDCNRKVFDYRCDDCSFSLDVACVALTLSPPEKEEEEEKETIRHFAHDHPLTSFPLNKPIKVECRACEQQISGPLMYGCPVCCFYLHESCTLLPGEIAKHPFHPQHSLTLFTERDFRCNACNNNTTRAAYGGIKSFIARMFRGKRYNRFLYKCNECRFRLDVQCATLVLPSDINQQLDCGTIQHFSHQHQLASFDVKMKSTGLHCKACRQKISGNVYGCPDCRFFLHRSCARELPQEMVHFLHPDHPLIFQAEPRYVVGGLRCNSCGVGSYFDFVFSCKRCNFDLDSLCALQTFSAFKEGIPTEIQHFSHDHPLTLCYSLSGSHDDCTVCGSAVIGLAYYCSTCNSPMLSNQEKRFVLHKACAELPQQLEHPFHPTHTLTLIPGQSDSSFYCDASCRYTKGFAYCCNECRFHLSLGAVPLKPTLKHQPHEHDLTHFETLGAMQCSYCGKRTYRDSYRCVQCNFTVHHGCISILPLSIKHDIHFHPLALCDKFIDRFDEQYCDACETTRRPDRGVYYCAKCNFAAHIGCVIPSVEIEETRPAQLEKVDREIASLETDIEETATNIETMPTKLEAQRKRLKELRTKRDDLAF
ncbi:hypothetical protein CDL15_Pgr000764 [Punica granatum]|uniref:Phorbol-ester/DAG-type domain-containing protein n=1 Tax=Punica granatum TaxID=22663 RepID=A0A218W5D6_PUNGR|nr:hypothetical protein CDL15_Pgr000764 [Punica granatum]PKI49159.1 hypothetical protein CRG98_030437 [Punica granatum]